MFCVRQASLVSVMVEDRTWSASVLFINHRISGRKYTLIKLVCPILHPHAAFTTSASSTVDTNTILVPRRLSIVGFGFARRIQRVKSYTSISEQYKYRHTYLSLSLNIHLLVLMPLSTRIADFEGYPISCTIIYHALHLLFMILHHGRSSFPHYAIPSRRPLDSDDNDDDDDEHLPVSRGIRSAVPAAASAHSRRKQRGTTLP